MKAREAPRIDYPKPDGVLTFDRLSSVFLSNTNHEENQPCHLRLLDPSIPVRINSPNTTPEQRYCPAAVYEIVRDETAPTRASRSTPELRPLQDLRYQGPDPEHRWVTPEGGGGPVYTNM
jgi:electron-transferring-flavoprotein dehydrogenase